MHRQPAGRVNIRESKHLMRRYEEGLAGYTYLSDDDIVDEVTRRGGEASAPASVQLPTRGAPSSRDARTPPEARIAPDAQASPDVGGAPA